MKMNYKRKKMTRIDIELVKRGIFETRNKAQNEIKNKIVYCNNVCITKPAFDVTDTDIIEIKGEKLKYVSRGGLKLEKAIKEFNIDLKDKILIDIGRTKKYIVEKLSKKLKLKV